MDKKAMTEHIKINLPLTEQDYEGGNGEGRSRDKKGLRRG